MQASDRQNYKIIQRHNVRLNWKDRSCLWMGKINSVKIKEAKTSTPNNFTPVPCLGELSRERLFIAGVLG